MKLTNDIVVTRAKALGFTLVGFTRAEPLTVETARLKKWLSSGYQAGMKYMERNIDKREDVQRILPGAKSVISLALNYYSPGGYSDNPASGKVSRYAWGKDYHLVMWEMLEKLITELKKVDLDFEAISYVDTGPVMDKAWAVRSGIGWMGKHTNIINRDTGSWFFIANLITNYEFIPSEVETDHCGSCTACLDACPTKAITEEYVVDANKCISYLTIENKQEIPVEFKGKMDRWIFGCDICQDVCPWNNKFSIVTSVSEFYPVNNELPLEKVEELTGSRFKESFSASPIKRAKLSGLKRNARFIKD